MPIVERDSPEPEWLDYFYWCLVIRTLESMFGQTLGYAVRAPEEVYRLRYEQVTTVEREIKEMRWWRNDLRFKGYTTAEIDEEFRQFSLLHLRRDKPRILEEILPIWQATDPELAPLITRLEPQFVNQPFSRLRRLSYGREAVGIICYYPSPHMFHLRLGEDFSDEGDFREDIQNTIAAGGMGYFLGRSRSEIGFSALIARPGC